jgi:hypothetical protein
VANAFDRGQELLKKYPQPKWLPQHFKVDTAFACSQDRSRRGAFVDIEESAQLCILMRNTKASSHGQFINSNVSVFIAPASRRPEVRGIARRWSEPFSLSGATAESVEARYYDSEPHDHSAFGAAHGIVTVKTGFAVLVMSFHKNGLSRQDLEEIAMSVS